MVRLERELEGFKNQSAASGQQNSAQDFRMALVWEIQFETGEVETWLRETREAVEGSDPRIGIINADLRSAQKLLARDTRLYDQMGQEDGPIEVRSGDFATIAHVFQSMAQKVVGPRLAEALEVGPLDEDYAADTLRDLIARLSWAVEHSARLHELAVADMSEEA